jgi:hypothetical protein
LSGSLITTRESVKVLKTRYSPEEGKFGIRTLNLESFIIDPFFACVVNPDIYQSKTRALIKQAESVCLSEKYFDSLLWIKSFLQEYGWGDKTT